MPGEQSLSRQLASRGNPPKGGIALFRSLGYNDDTVGGAILPEGTARECEIGARFPGGRTVNHGSGAGAGGEAEMRQCWAVGSAVGCVLLLGSVLLLGWNPALVAQAEPLITATPTSPPLVCTVVCTPPACEPGEVYYCPETCPCGCGTECATRTPVAGTEPPPALPESSTLVLLGLGSAGLMGFVGLQILARRHAPPGNE